MQISKDVVERYQDIVTKKSVIDPITGCWIWVGHVDPLGYGRIKRTEFGHTNPVLAHRLAYAAFNGEITTGLVVRHTCDVRRCVNPKHLLLGTHADNVRDRVLRGRGGLTGRKPKEMNPRVLRMLRELGYTLKTIGAMFGVTGTTIGVRLRKFEEFNHARC